MTLNEKDVVSSNCWHGSGIRSSVLLFGEPADERKRFIFVEVKNAGIFISLNEKRQLVLNTVW